MHTRQKNVYEAPASLVVEMEFERGLCQTSPNRAVLTDYYYCPLDES